jgi:branched-subunit amino acid ABC-type transport system permease component
VAEVIQVIVAGLSQGAIYALLGLGFSTVFLATRILNLAQGSFALWGGFIFLSLVAGAKVPLALSFFIVLLISAVLGALTELLVSLRSKPWKPISLDMAVLSTLALLVFFEGAAFMIWGPDPQRGPALQRGVFSLFGAIVPWQLVWMIVGAIAIATGLQIFLRATWSGRAMRACAQNPMMSNLLGINVRRIGALAFALGAMIGATAGILASPITWLDYQLGGTFALNGILAYLIGGEEDVAGPVLGGFLLGIVQSALLLLPGATGGMLEQVVPMLALIVMLAFRPQGLLARRV